MLFSAAQFQRRKVASTVEDARIVWDAKTALFDNLKYDFNYNESENTIHVNYWFTSAIPDEAASIVRFVPHAQSFRYLPPKHRGRKPALDAIFDDPQKMLWITRQAEQEFEQGLGQTIETALQLFIHLTMYRCGAIAWKETSKSMANLFAKAFRGDIAKQLKIKRGPLPRFRDADHYRETLLECIKTGLAEGEINSVRQITQSKVAEIMARIFNPEGDTLDDRMIRQWNKEHGVEWLKFVKESWKELTAEN